jgi:hypothetical protein
MVDWLFSLLEVHHVRYIVVSSGKLQLIGIINSVRKISVKKQICIEFLEFSCWREKGEKYLFAEVRISQKYWARKSVKCHICGRSAKSNKLFESPNWRICDLRNLFTDYPHLKSGIDPHSTTLLWKIVFPKKSWRKAEQFSTADTDPTSFGVKLTERSTRRLNPKSRTGDTVDFA